MQLCFFEDKPCTRFKPLTLTRPASDLRVGILTIAEKWETTFNGSKIIYCGRPKIKNVFSTHSMNKNEPCLWINSRYLPSKQLLEHISRLQTGSCLQSDHSTIAAKVSGSKSAQWLRDDQPAFNKLKTGKLDTALAISYLWDLFAMNEKEIERDINRLNSPHAAQNSLSTQATLQNEENIFIGKNAHIQAGATLVAEKGPIYIGDNAKISAGAIIQGPAAICANAVIKLGAKIRSNTTVGPFCTVGGEVAKSIFHSYSNKGHDGYAGNSLIGQWCNFGAGTNTSNLKNNYSNVRITSMESQEIIETGQQSLGTVMGDHTKTAIGTRLNTGTICGVNCNIFAGDFPPKFIPSFSWVSSDEIVPYKLEKAFKTMEAMMSRRDIELTAAYKTLMKSIFNQRRKV